MASNVFFVPSADVAVTFSDLPGAKDDRIVGRPALQAWRTSVERGLSGADYGSGASPFNTQKKAKKES